MGFSNFVDALLFIAIVSLLFDAQICMPCNIFPNILIELKSNYTREFSDYLVAEKPNFFVGLIALEVLIQWPICIANLYGIFNNKSWVRTTCLIYGVSSFTNMVAILSEMVLSHRATDKLLMVYAPFLVFAVIAILRGVVIPVSELGFYRIP